MTRDHRLEPPAPAVDRARQAHNHDVRLAERLATNRAVGLAIVAAGLFLVWFNLAGPIRDIRQGNRDAACRAVFAGAVTDARSEQDAALADAIVALGGRDTPSFNKALVKMGRAKADLEATNAQYQHLLRANRGDFRRMCAAGP